VVPEPLHASCNASIDVKESTFNTNFKEVPSLIIMILFGKQNNGENWLKGHHHMDSHQ